MLAVLIVLHKSHADLVRAVAALANGIGMSATAEGVKTQEQLDAVKSEGCIEMQGFLFSRALPPREIEQRFLLNRSKAEKGPPATS